MNRHATSGLLIVLLIIIGTGLSGCGQKGPLYLPNEQQQAGD